MCTREARTRERARVHGESKRASGKWRECVHVRESARCERARAGACAQDRERAHERPRARARERASHERERESTRTKERTWTRECASA
ncbi:hypothetical protein chiPu_0024959 [Chiloscyllium punctatum]|uniref:Uncharacterized protein n=1 Tax=Chiloscyllium punctatum TaxID=137246 RepID=A0A401TDJ3_CHIPU|nr:hypothetical protein [Chiloscyllium punctatum]